MKCRHEHRADAVCSDCGVKIGTCPNPRCSKTVALDAEGYIAYHDFPEPCRAVCPGSKHSSVEDVACATVKPSLARS